MSFSRLDTTWIHLGPDGTSVPLPVTEQIWEQLASGAFDHLGPGRLVSQVSFDADWLTWEMHPAGEEIVCLVSGAVDLVLDGEAGRRTVSLRRAGSFVIVPRGTWHTADVIAPSAMLFITPGDGTQHRER
jgi:mannose-6-phosphate isomerase-like protein (cupin superfamily)